MTDKPQAKLRTRIPKRLFWQLMRTYLLGTVSVALGLELLVLVLLFLPTAQYLSDPQRIVRDTTEGAAEVAPMLEASPLRLAELTKALQDATGEIVVDPHQHEMGLMVYVQVSPWAYVAVTDAQGVVLACSPAKTWQVGQPLALQVPAQEAEMLRQAAAGTIASCAADMPPQGKRTTVAAPVLGTKHQRLGTVFVRHEVPFNWWTTVRMLIAYLTPTLLFGILVAGVSGLVLGWLSAWGLVRRIAGITRTAASWSRGELAVAIPPSGNDELGQLAQQLNHMAEQLSGLLAQQRDYAAAAERAKLSRDLHDTVKQQVLATALELATARAKQQTMPEEAGIHLARAAEMVQHVQTDLADIVAALRTGEEQPAQELALLLRAAISLWSRQTGIVITLSTDSLPLMKWEHALPLVRIMQGALANIARHSRATRVGVQLCRTENRLSMSIEDNGEGFVVTPELLMRGGLGMMRERAESLPGGALEVRSTPGAGTRITVHCTIEGA